MPPAANDCIGAGALPSRGKSPVRSVVITKFLPHAIGREIMEAGSTYLASVLIVVALSRHAQIGVWELPSRLSPAKTMSLLLCRAYETAGRPGQAVFVCCHKTQQIYAALVADFGSTGSAGFSHTGAGSATWLRAVVTSPSAPQMQGSTSPAK